MIHPMRAMLVSLALLAAVPASAGELFEGVVASPPEPVQVGDRYEVAPPIRYGGVAVYPVVDRQAGAVDPAQVPVPLARALQEGTVTVSEIGEGAEVARLLVHNAGDRPVLVTAGDLLYGGNQDRVITEDVLVPPSSQPVTVSVHCVEEGRWSSSGGAFGYAGRAETDLRHLVQVAGEQGATWRAVTRLNDAKRRALAGDGVEEPGLAPATDTYLASVHSQAVDRQVDKVTASIVERLDKVHDAVGVVIAVQGRVIGSEVYAGPALFDAVQGPTVAALARDALSWDLLRSDAAAPRVRTAAVFLEEALADDPGTGIVASSYGVRDAGGGVVHLASWAR